MSLHVRGKTKQLVRHEGGDWSVPVGPSEHMIREFAPLGSRKLDERLYAQSTTSSDWTVKLPPGARVVTAPKPAELASPFGKFTLTVESGPSSLHVTTSLTS